MITAQHEETLQQRLWAQKRFVLWPPSLSGSCRLPLCATPVRSINCLLIWRKVVNLGIVGLPAHYLWNNFCIEEQRWPLGRFLKPKNVQSKVHINHSPHQKVELKVVMYFKIKHNIYLICSLVRCSMSCEAPLWFVCFLALVWSWMTSYIILIYLIWSLVNLDMFCEIRLQFVSYTIR